MTNDAPTWDPRDPTESLLRQADWLNQLARETFARDGTHVEILFFFREDGQGAIGQPPPGMARVDFMPLLKASIRENDIFGVIHIAESWTYLPRQPNDHTFRQIADGEIAVSQLDPNDQSEALMVKVDARSGLTRTWLYPILRTPTLTSLGEPMEINHPAPGRLANLFSDPDTAT